MESETTKLVIIVQTEQGAELGRVIVSVGVIGKWLQWQGGVILELVEPSVRVTPGHLSPVKEW